MTGDVLVLRALGLGDALTGVAALRGVRRAWPGRRVVLAAPTAVGAWLRDLALVDDVVPTDGVHGLPERLAWAGAGHVAVNLHGRGPQSHRLLQATGPGRLVAFANPEVGVPGPAWRDDEHEVARWCRLLRWAGGNCSAVDLRLPRPRPRGSHVVVHPGAASPARRWPPDRWAAVVAGLTGEGRAVVVTGTAEECELCAHVVRAAVGLGAEPRLVTDTSGRLDLPGLADVVGRAALVVCGDTGVAHLATGLRTRSVVLFGPVSPALWGPATDPDRHVVLWHGSPEHPGDPHGAEPDPALRAIDVDEVLDAAVRLLERRRAPVRPSGATPA